jgi:hypothetical protein
LGIEDMKTAADTTPKLTRAQKADVVRRLAAYDSPGAIAKSLKQDYGIEITRQAIAFYDPTRYSARRRPKRWADLFRETRAEIIAGKADAGAAHRLVRVRRLDQMACDQMDKGNAAEARALLKQAADEMSRMAEERNDASGTAYSQLSYAEIIARFAAAAAKLGHALVPLGDHAAAGGHGGVDEPQPPGDPVPG